MRPYFKLRRQCIYDEAGKSIVLCGLTALTSFVPMHERSVGRPLACLVDSLAGMEPLALLGEWSPPPCNPEVAMRLDPELTRASQSRR